MPNIVSFDGENFFVMDIRTIGKRIEYLLDDGRWVNAAKVEIVD